MTYSSNFIKAIRMESGYNPFSVKFDKGLTLKSAETSHDHQLAISLIWLHVNIFNPLLNSVVEHIKNSGLTYAQLSRYTIALLNHNTHTNQTIYREKINLTKEVNLLKENDSIFENIVNLMNFLLQFFSCINFANGTKQSSFEEDQLDRAEKIVHLGSCCSEYQKHYENVIWTGGRVEIGKDKIYFHFGHETLQKSRDIGIKSVQNDLLNSNGDYNLEMIKRNIGLRRIQENPFVADSLNFVSGKHIKLRKRKVSDTVAIHDFLAVVGLYYSHLLSFKLPKLNGLTIQNCAEIISEIQSLILLFRKPTILSPKLEAKNIKEYLPRIRVKDFESYLVKILPFKEKTILQFLEKCIYFDSKNNADIHINPLKVIDGYVYMSFNQIERSSVHLMIDNWVVIGGLNNSEKGRGYERYLKENLEFEINKGNKDAEVISVRKIKGYDRDLDLVLRAGDYYYVIEAKATMYPLNSRRYYNNYYYEDLKKACEQLAYAKDFILNCSEKLPKQLADIRKENIKFFIITNFPTYNGMKINGFPILDHETLLCYFRTHSMKTMLRGLNTNKVIEEETYYNNDMEFSKNLISYITSPPFYKKCLRKTLIQRYKYSVNPNLPDIEYDHILFSKY